MIKELLIEPLKIIPGDKGSVLHALKSQDQAFVSFGEAYFSIVSKGAVKGWKRHREMILNIVVPVGEIEFVLFDPRPESPTYQQVQTLKLSRSNYQRLTVPPGVWLAFKGLAEPESMLLNLASIPHDPSEADQLPIVNDLIPFVWPNS